MNEFCSFFKYLFCGGGGEEEEIVSIEFLYVLLDSKDCRHFLKSFYRISRNKNRENRDENIKLLNETDYDYYIMNTVDSEPFLLFIGD